MKKEKSWSLLALCLCITGALAFTACGDDDDDKDEVITQQEYAQKYLSVSKGVYHTEAMPASTTSSRLTGVSTSGTAKANGTTTITISSDVEYERFYIGVDGQSGYIEYVPGTRTRASGKYTYDIPVNFGSVTSETLDVIIKGQTVDGEVTSAYRQPISFTNFSIDIGTNHIRDVAGKWRCDFVDDEYVDDGVVYRDYVRMDVTFNSSNTEFADFTLEEYTLDKQGGSWDGAWAFQVEGQAKCSGSTLHLYFRRVRSKTFDGDWGEWKDKGSPGMVGPSISWQSQYNTWSDFINQSTGNVLFECLLNDAKTNMQWRALVVDYDHEHSQVVYNYDPDEPIMQFTKQ